MDINLKRLKPVILLLMVMGLFALTVACGDANEIIKEKIVEKVVEVEKVVPGPTQIVEKIVPGPTQIIEKIVEVVKDGRITGISDVRDESDRDGIRLVIELKKNEDSQVILNQLFQYTPLQVTVSIINLAIDHRRPRTFTIRGLLDAFLEHRREVIRRRTAFLLRKAEDRKHIVDGLRIAVGNIDQIVNGMRNSVMPGARMLMIVVR